MSVATETKQYKYIPLEVKINIDKREFEGYASIFGNVDLVGEVVEFGAFAKTIKERLPRNLIKVFWEHIYPMGMPRHMEEDSTGLYTVSRASNTRDNIDRLELMKDGVVDRMSIGYDIIKREVVELDEGRDPVIHLKELRLYEYSPVAFAANEDALILAVKNAMELDSLVGQFPALELLKEGRVLSSANRSKVEAAIEALQALLQAADGEPDKSTPPPEKDGLEPPKVDQIDPGSLQSVLDSMRSYRISRFGG